jgi:AraC-like DNA-binding protein
MRGADVVYLNGLTFPYHAPLAVVLKGNLEQLARRSIGGDPCASEELRERLAFATDPLSAKMAAIVRAMQADPMRRVSQDELVRCLGMERTRALRAFKAATGLTFRRFKLWSALQHATLRMAERELVRTAAMDAGFADTAHLSRVFSSMFGLSPSVAIAGLDDRRLRFDQDGVVVSARVEADDENYQQRERRQAPHGGHCPYFNESSGAGKGASVTFSR